MGILESMSTSASGIAAQAYALENISGNIANSATVGFKQVDTSFTDLIGDTSGSGPVPSGSVGSNPRQSTNAQGAISATGVATNMALSGEGFFVVAANDGTASSPTFSATPLYTRRGDFAEDANGYLVNGAGDYLCGTTLTPGGTQTATSGNGPIKIAHSLGSATLSDISVSSDGSIVGRFSDGSNAKVAQVAVAHPTNADGLTPVDGGAYVADAGTPALGLNGTALMGGSVEQSTTDIAAQFSKMIATQQAYSFNTKVMTTANEMLQAAINIVR